MYTVSNRSRRVTQEIDSLPENDYQRVAAAIDSLTDNPRPQGCRKLEDDIYRIRVGDYRIIYLVDDGRQKVDIGAIRRRSEATYRGIRDLFR